MNAGLADFLQYLINGIALGSLYALIAVGYSLVYGVLELVNFAHAELFMLGAYFLMLAVTLGMPFPFAVLASLVSVAVIAVLMERFAYRPLRGAGRLAPLITAVGLSIFLQNLVQAFFSPDPRSFPVLLPGGIVSFLDDALFLRQRDLIILAVTLVLTLLLELFFHRTRAGLGIRALAMHPEAARIVGVPVDRSIALTFFLGGLGAALAGILQGMALNQIAPLMGLSAGLKAFAAAVLGGIGILSGAVLGGFVIGLAESLLVGYDLSSYKDGLAFLVLILVLLLRPAGILGSRKTVKV